MAYVHPFNTSTPAGSAPANVDDDLRELKAGINERFNDVFGFDFESDDPLEPSKIGPALSIQGAQIGTAIFNAGNSGTTKTINWNDGDQQRLTLTANCSLSFTNVVPGRSYQLFILHGSTNGLTISFPSSVLQSGGTVLGTPPLTATANRHSLVALTAFSTSIIVGTVVYTGVPSS
jgi:hypothetical protein